MTETLFSPLTIGKLELPGRIFKTATSETRGSEDGFVTDELLDFYAPIAWAGTPLIITGNLYISVQGKSTYRMCGIDNDDKIPGLTRWTELAHQYGSRIFAQINHCGRQMNPDVIGVKEALAPSAVRDKAMLTKPRAMTLNEIEEVIEDHVAAVVRAQKAGFDGVQIHMAHGYLLSEFLTPQTNRRKDQYGGSLENRMRLPLEVLRAVRKRVGPDYPVIAKLNGADLLLQGKGLDTDELVQVAQALQAEGLDGIEISCGHYESGFPMICGRFDGFLEAQVAEGAGKYLPAPMRMAAKLGAKALAKRANKAWPTREGFNGDFSRQFKAALDIPVICVGGFHTREAMEQAINSGVCDAVSIARAMIADPFLVQHLREGVEGPQCDFCNGCIARAGGSPVDCYNDKLRPARQAMLKEAGFDRM
ncbi:NADH:flavin oxidoreductase [Marinobacter sp. SS21]|uniref:NADH:flavin oxidoreductase n=1 Tax=Marinobacter sp. SS21 TaxID=2979460 RepID=UPI00232EAF86|nr:NADH:flavin oxidoreductase [Marinobacter sp. SS21]MDC0661363.1 NADH:flavin oxidoreductase [Marinobacter sp. SS21]